MHEVLVNRLGGLSLPRKSVVRLTDRPDMTLDVYRGRKTTIQQIQQQIQQRHPGRSVVRTYNKLENCVFSCISSRSPCVCHVFVVRSLWSLSECDGGFTNATNVNNAS